MSEASEGEVLRRRPKPISLALQGGGAHGAFGWGVLDYLLEDNRVRITAMTAASAGAMNAVNVAAGLMKGGPDGAREQLDSFWTAVARAGALFNPAHAAPWESFMKGLGVDNGFAFFDALARMTSPYDRNPFDFNPLREILTEHVDFERLRRESPVEVFVSATNVRSGKVRVFDHAEMTVEAVLASACLPILFQAVEIDGEAYWDGGYVGNPALFPLLKEKTSRDLVIVHLNPLHREKIPTTADAIMDRLNEITFNASLLAELRSIAFAQQLLHENWLTARFRSRVRDVFIHSIRADDALSEFTAASKFNTDLKFLTELRARGRETAAAWLDDTHRALGKRSSVDLFSDYLDPQRTEPV